MNKGCPDQETLAAFAAGTVDSIKEGFLLQHFITCDACCRALRFAYACQIADKRQKWPAVSALEQERVTQVLHLISMLKDSPSERALLWLRFSLAIRPCHEVMAAADGQTPDQKLQAAALSGHIHFCADCDRKSPGFWQARLALPVVPAPETELRIRIRDAKGDPINEGTLILCGIELAILAGCAKICLADLQGHLDKPMVALRFTDGKEFPGAPKLFDSEEQ